MITEVKNNIGKYLTSILISSAIIYGSSDLTNRLIQNTHSNNKFGKESEEKIVNTQILTRYNDKELLEGTKLLDNIVIQNNHNEYNKYDILGKYGKQRTEREIINQIEKQQKSFDTSQNRQKLEIIMNTYLFVSEELMFNGVKKGNIELGRLEEISRTYKKSKSVEKIINTLTYKNKTKRAMTEEDSLFEEYTNQILNDVDIGKVELENYFRKKNYIVEVENKYSTKEKLLSIAGAISLFAGGLFLRYKNQTKKSKKNK